MSLPKPTTDQVRTQLERLCRHRLFATARSDRATTLLIENWALDGGIKLVEEFIGPNCVGEAVENENQEGEPAKYGCPRTRAHLSTLRAKLAAYYETDGYCDPVIIKLNVGAYKPAIGYNPVTDMTDIDRRSELILFRAKSFIDTRNNYGARRAIDQLSSLDSESSHARILANMAFIPYAAAAIIQYFALSYRMRAEHYIARVRATGFEPWECTFADGCLHASRNHDWSKALALFRTSAETSQGQSIYFWWHTALLASTGYLPEAIHILDSAVRHFLRDSVSCRSDLAILLTMAQRYRDASEMLALTYDISSLDRPAFARANAILFEAAGGPDDCAMFLRAYHPTIKPLLEWPLPVDPDEYSKRWDFILMGVIALMCGHLGRTENAEGIFGNHLYVRQRVPISGLAMALPLIGLGRYDEAVNWLEIAAHEDDPYVMWFHIFPPLRHLAGHHGYRKLLKNLNLRLHRDL